ncbi:kinase-like domain-containing protein [Mycena floridula]|nr:kinase-like domain-containing protein [Mycena floridula]
MSVPFLDQYDPLDIIGNGSFGIIRKVRRKTDGLIFARKELNFERMTERDRKQIVAEVNILKDLHHDHIVRYHDRYVDREAGILYILMEYCGGGDLSTVIKQAIKHDRPIPEDTVWNYFMQLLLALQHCHHPNGHGRNGSSGGPAGLDADGKERRAQILHRDLKPDNVFLDENNTVKLGDFGLSKALAQASFANTYVGTPYYMSPELMQEKAYDSKSDIWSLGCLIYELCALKPPFHEAQTHSELSILIRNGRIPPLPKTFSQSMTATIKAMLNLNPAMRPSVAQLLQHERIEFAFKVTESEKMLQNIKNHRSTIATREREVLAREAVLLEKEQHITALISQKDGEISNLQQLLAQQQVYGPKYTQDDMELAVRTAIAKREEELRVLVTKREEEVAVAIARREEEIIASVNRREAELCEAWTSREQQIRQEVDDKVQWIQTREKELIEEEERLQSVKEKLEEKMKKWEEKSSLKGRKDKTPLEEVKNILEPVTNARTPMGNRKGLERCPSPYPNGALATPLLRQSNRAIEMPSAMKGVILTATGQALSTPAPGELATLFVNSPKVGLNFTKIFDFEQEPGKAGSESEDEGASPPPSPSMRRDRRKQKSEKQFGFPSDSPASSSNQTSSSSLPPTRIRRPSIRTRRTTPSIAGSSTEPAVSSPIVQPKPLPHPHLQQTIAAPVAMRAAPPVPRRTSPDYDSLDEENLPSPFIKPSQRLMNKRPSTGNMLRAVAAANSAGRKGSSGTALSDGEVGATRPALTNARKATEEARKALQRQSTV